MFGGDNELGNMLQEAVKLKTCQMNQKRGALSTAWVCAGVWDAENRYL